jgi:Rrf2 family transcriptional regulator, iron-sulfur cluster assembly transcription factor
MRLELTRRGSYAIRAAVSLARIDGDTLTSSARIAAAMGIPPRFLPQVMGDLVRAGLVEGVVGRAGGYRLARDAAVISLLEVIEAAEGDARRRTCVLKGVDCRDQQSACDVHAVFSAAQEALLRELAGTTLAQVLDAGLEPALAPGSEGADLVQGAAG